MKEKSSGQVFNDMRDLFDVSLGAIKSEIQRVEQENIIRI